MDNEERLDLAEGAFNKHVREVIAPAYLALAEAMRHAADLAQDMEEWAELAKVAAPSRFVDGEDPTDLARCLEDTGLEVAKRGLR